MEKGESISTSTQDLQFPNLLNFLAMTNLIYVTFTPYLVATKVQPWNFTMWLKFSYPNSIDFQLGITISFTWIPSTNSVDPAFRLMRFPLDGELDFNLKNDFFIDYLKMTWSRHLFLFYF